MGESAENGMHVVRVSVHNFERLVAIEVEPDPEDPLVQVTSKKNGAGKSSLLNAIAAALGGPDWMPKKPVHGDAEKGEVSVDVGPYTIRRSFTKGGGGQVTIKRNEDGSVLSRPAETLADWRSDLTLDPFEFVGMKDKERRAVLLGVLGIEEKLAELDANRERAFSSRTEVNREIKRLKGAAAEYEDVPEEEPEVPDVSALRDQRADREAKQREVWDAWRDRTEKREARQEALDEANAEVERREQAIDGAKDAIAEAEAALDAAKNGLTAAEKAAETARLAREDRAEELAASSEPGDEPPIAPDCSDIDEALERASDTAILKTRWEAAAKVRADLSEAELKSEGLTGKLDAMEREKDELLAGSDLPLPELGVDEKGVTFGGHPFPQASDAEKLRAGFAVAMARNPKTRVALIRNGSQLDDDNLALFRQLGHEFDCQVWIESLDRTGTTGVVIEDGRLADKMEESDA